MRHCGWASNAKRALDLVNITEMRHGDEWLFGGLG